MEKNKKNTVPQLRFPEFDGEWNTSTIEDVSKVTTGNKDTQDKIDNGKYPFFVRSQTVENINSFSFDGEAILTSGDGVGVGKIYHYIVGKFDFHQRVYCLYDFKEEVSGKFIFFYFSKHFYQRVMQLSAKNSVDSVRRAMITEMPIYTPVLKEQQKIANCLSSLDNLITAETEKLNLLKDHKKGLLQQLFPAKGETKPKFRFPEFLGDGDWEDVKLIDVTDKNKKWSFTGGPFGSNLKSSDYVKDDKGIRIIQLQNIGDGEFKNEYKIYTSKEKADELLSCNIYPGDIIMSKMGDPVGRACLIPDYHNRYVMSSDGIRIVINKEKYDKYLIFLIINSKTFRAKVENASTGSTRKRIGLVVLKNLTLTIPKDKIEQQKIANCLSSLDASIEEQVSKIEALKEHKKGLMQQLFPNVNQ